MTVEQLITQRPKTSECGTFHAAQWVEDAITLLRKQAEKIEEFHAEIYGCHCSPPYTDCPHSPPLLSMVNELSIKNREQSDRIASLEEALAYYKTVRLGSLGGGSEVRT